MHDVKRARGSSYLATLLILLVLVAVYAAIDIKYQNSATLSYIFSIIKNVTSWSINVVAELGVVGVFALMALESSSLPIPSEVVLPFAGFLSASGKLDFPSALLWATVGAMIGSYIDYYIGMYLGTSLLVRKNIISKKALDAAHSWFTKYGATAVFASRFLAGARTLINFPAGASRMNVFKFGVYTLAGCLLWNASLMYAGYLLGQNWEAAVAAFNSVYVPAAIASIVVIIAVLVIYFLKRRKK